MTTPPKRRWCRFSLRTMFVVVTVAAVPLSWLVWQIQIVRERNRLRIFYSQAGEIVIVKNGEEPNVNTALSFPGDKTRRVSAIRKLLGDDDAESIIFLTPTTPPHAGRDAIVAFPEADVLYNTN